MLYRYIVRTSVPRNFDPDVEGLTLDSIVNSCDGIVGWSFPNISGYTEIKMILDRPLDYGYLVGQLNTEFENLGAGNVVLSISRRGNF